MVRTAFKRLHVYAQLHPTTCPQAVETQSRERPLVPGPYPYPGDGRSNSYPAYPQGPSMQPSGAAAAYRMLSPHQAPQGYPAPPPHLGGAPPGPGYPPPGPESPTGLRVLSSDNLGPG